MHPDTPHSEKALKHSRALQFMRSSTDHRSRVSICKTCLATVADAPSDSELITKEQDHVCRVESPETQHRVPRRDRSPQPSKSLSD